MAFVVVFVSVLTSVLAFVARHIALVDLTYNNFGCNLAMHMLVGKVTGIEEEGRTAGRWVLQHLPKDLYWREMPKLVHTLLPWEMRESGILRVMFYFE